MNFVFPSQSCILCIIVRSTKINSNLFINLVWSWRVNISISLSSDYSYLFSSLSELHKRLFDFVSFQKVKSEREIYLLFLDNLIMEQFSYIRVDKNSSLKEKRTKFILQIGVMYFSLSSFFFYDKEKRKTYIKL